MKFSELPDGARFKLHVDNEIVKKLVCIKVDRNRFAELEYGSYELAEEVVRVCYGDFDVVVVERGTK